MISLLFRHLFWWYSSLRKVDRLCVACVRVCCFRHKATQPAWPQRRLAKWMRIKQQVCLEWEEQDIACFIEFNCLNSASTHLYFLTFIRNSHWKEIESSTREGRLSGPQYSQGPCDCARTPSCTELAQKGHSFWFAWKKGIWIVSDFYRWIIPSSDLVFYLYSLSIVPKKRFWNRGIFSRQDMWLPPFKLPHCNCIRKRSPIPSREDLITDHMVTIIMNDTWM